MLIFKIVHGLLWAVAFVSSTALFGGILIYVSRWFPVVLEYPGWLILGGLILAIPSGIGLKVLEPVVKY